MAQNETVKNVGLLVLGAAVGAALGLLLAPKPGNETREQIGDWLKERREKSAGFINNLKERLPAKKDQIAAALKAGKEAYYENAQKEEVTA